MTTGNGFIIKDYLENPPGGFQEALGALLAECLQNSNLSREERLRRIDLEVAALDRRRRFLVKRRREEEQKLGDVEALIDGTAVDYLREELSVEREKVMDGLRKIDLSLAELDRDRRRMRKKQRKMERLPF